MTQIIDQALQDERMRLDRIQKANNAYNGQYENVLKVPAGKPDDNVRANFAKFIVNEGAEFLFGAGLKVTLSSGSDGAAAKYLKKVMKRNKAPTFLNKLAVAGAISGHPFIKLVASKVDGESCRWILQDSAEMNVTWDCDDIEEVIRYKIQYNATNKAGKPVIHKQVIEAVEDETTDTVTSWVVRDFEAQRINALGSIIAQGEWVLLSTVEWPYPWAPIFDCQNLPMPNCFYGMSDLEPDILHIINRIQFVLSNTLRINRIHAHPKTVGKGFTAPQLTTNSDDMLMVPLTGDITALQAGGDIAGSIEVYRALQDVLFMISKIPPVVLGKMDSIGQLAGVALRILYGPLMEVTRRKRDTYGDMLEQLIQRSLELGGFADEEVTLEWGDPMPQNDLEARQVGQMDLDMNLVSLETLASKFGYDWQKEKKKIADEEQGGVRPAAAPPAPAPMYDPNVDNIPQ